MIVERDEEADAAYVRLSDAGAYAYGEDLDPARRIDYSREGHPIGVELLNVSRGVDVTDLPDADAIATRLAGLGIAVHRPPARSLG